jgi:hypothetical protein
MSILSLIYHQQPMHIPVILEDSGNRGYHLWFFFTEPIPAEQARRLLRWITRQCAPVSDHITREVFPKEKRMGNSNGSVIKLPLGIHSASGRRSLFLTHDGEVDPDQPGVLRSISMIEPEVVRSILARSIGEEPNLLTDMSKRQAIKEKLLPKEWETYPVVSSVLNHCLLLKFLSLKALEFKYLQHQERLAILQTFAHLGQEGKDMIHRVMEGCLNYNRQTTERFISRVMPKPISCPRLRENFPELTSAFGCDCRFRLPSKAYPSPVLHALGISGHKVQLLAIQENANGISQEDRLKVEGLVKRLSELHKQGRGIQKAIGNVENTLSVVFKDKEINEMEISIGTLVCLQQDGKVRWVINL